MGVTRIDLPERRLIGWLVAYRSRTRWTRRYFSDQKFGGSAQAREAALDFEAKSEAARREILYLERRLNTRRNTKSGLVGVTRVVRRSGQSSWIAYWTDDTGRRKSKRFAVSKYGEAEAMRLAIEARLSNAVEDIARLSELLQE